MPAARRKYYCTVEPALDRLKGKWKPAIIYHLKTGGVQFGELKRRIPGISTRMLTLTSASSKPTTSSGEPKQDHRVHAR